MLTSSLFSICLAASAFALPQVAKRAKTTTVHVGNDGKLSFDPPAIYAKVGDVVDFVFTSKNHSVVQSSFAAPCGPLDGGFKSGFQFVAPDTKEDALPKVTYTVQDDSKPLWFYCSQAIHTPNSHCHAGMVFSINCPPTGENSLPNFISKAKADPAATEAVAATPTPTDGGGITLAPEPTYSGITIPPPESAATKTDVITLGTSTWTTTYASYPNSPDPTPNAENGNEIKVIVGKDNTLTFDPPFVQAKPRDRIVFEFQSKNHSVAQSSFAAPCAPFFAADGSEGISSGFQPVTAGQPFPTFTVTINTTQPHYFYCQQTGHCGKGMVFAVNTDEKGDRSSNAFQSLAKQINGTTTSSSGSSGGYGYGGSGSASRSSTSVGALAAAGVVAAFAAFVL